jgi:uncharacterized membrane protein
MSHPTRLPYLDWVRGVAAIIMLQGHVFNSLIRTDLRTSGPYVFSQFVGGMPPAIFLFLTGVTLAFLMDSSERKELPGAQRISAVLKRAGFLLGVAFLFRIQLWAFSSPRNVADIFRVDILNCMGFAIVVASPMAIFRSVERIRLCAILGVSIAAASPLISQVDWTFAPEVMKNYLVPSGLFFGFFPWAAFLFFGVSLGSLLRTLKEEQIPQAMQWFAVGGVVLAFSAYSLSNTSLTIYSKSDFWLDGPALTLIKTGIVLVGIAFAYLWTLQSSAQSWSWVRQFGATSLLVYWVHIELVYGRWLGAMKQELTLNQTVVAAALITVAMLLLSLAKTTFPTWREKLLSAPQQPSRDFGD